jgi:hypothetical protein
MTLNYQKVWDSMNSLEMVTSKICSAREILESALNALENHKYDKVEALMYATDEFLQYYLSEFDEKFKVAWKETVVKLNKDQYSYLANDILTKDRVSNFPGEQYTEEELTAMCNKAEQDQITFCDKNNSSEKCGQSWADFWEENYYPEEYYEHVSPNATQKDIDKVKKWVLPVQEIENGDTMENEYFIQLPDDLLGQTGWKEDDVLNWVDNGDGSFTLTKTNG